MTKEQVYRLQMIELGIWEEIFAPEVATLCQIEREYTRAKKAWSRTAPPGGKPSVLDEHYAVIQRLRSEILQHRESLGLTPKSLKKLVGAAGTDAPVQKDLITAKLDEIASRVAGYDLPPDPFAGIPGAAEVAEISDRMDREDHPNDQLGDELRKAVAEDMG